MALAPRRWIGRSIPVCLLLLAAAGGARAGEVQVEGWVRGLDRGDSAVVTLSGPVKRETSVRPGGHWRIRGVPPGNYQAKPSSPGYRFVPPARTVEVSGAQVSAVNFRAKSTGASPAARSGAPGHSVRGRIHGLKPGDRVRIEATGPRSGRTMTRSGGRYKLEDLPPGTYRISAADARYRFRPAARTVRIRRGDRRNIHFKARPAPRSGRGAEHAVRPKPKPKTFSLHGRVNGLKALLHGCSRATVLLRGPKQARTRTRKSEDARVCGTFAFEDLPPGEYTLTVRIRNTAMQYWDVSPEKRTVRLRGDVKGVVFDADVHSEPRHRRHRNRSRRRRW